MPNVYICTLHMHIRPQACVGAVSQYCAPWNRHVGILYEYFNNKILLAVKIHIVVFMVWTSCSLADGCPAYKTHTRIHKFSKNLESPATPTCQKGDRKQVSYLGPWILEWPLNLTVFWCVLPGECEMMNILVFKERNCVHDSKMSHPHCVYINNRCSYQSITQQYLKRCLIKDDSNYMFRPIVAIIRFSSESMVVVLYRWKTSTRTHRNGLDTEITTDTKDREHTRKYIPSITA